MPLGKAEVASAAARRLDQEPLSGVLERPANVLEVVLDVALPDPHQGGELARRERAATQVLDETLS